MLRCSLNCVMDVQSGQFALLLRALNPIGAHSPFLRNPKVLKPVYRVHASEFNRMVCEVQALLHFTGLSSERGSAPQREESRVKHGGLMNPEQSNSRVPASVPWVTGHLP